MSLSLRSPSNAARTLMMRPQLTSRHSVGFITREMGDSLAKRAAVSLAVLYEQPDIACSSSNTLTRRCHLAPQTPFAVYFPLNPPESVGSTVSERNRCTFLRSIFSKA